MLRDGDIVHRAAVLAELFVECGLCHRCKQPIGQILIGHGKYRRWLAAQRDGGDSFRIHACHKRLGGPVAA